jgi:hypothetical protein
MNVGRVFLTELPRRWDDDSKSFVIQGKYSMFTTEEVSIVMGLYANGMKVNVELKRRKSEPSPLSRSSSCTGRTSPLEQ